MRPLNNLLAPRTISLLRTPVVLAILSLAAGGLATGGALAPAIASATGDTTAPSCPNEAMVGFAANLPDCRAYEQVSPTKKDGGSGGVIVFGTLNQEAKRLPFQSTADGSAITYPGEPFFDIPPRDAGQNELAQYTSVRSSDAWNTTVGDTLSPEVVPVPVLPPSAGEEPRAKVLEETPDGSKVFFLDEKHGPGITPDSNAAENEPDLYEYNVTNKELTDLTVDNTEHADARGILGIGGENTEQGSYVYFVAGGIFSPEASQGGCLLEVNGLTTGEGCNLYLRHGGTTTFIATLSPKDEQGASHFGDVFDWPVSPHSRTAEVSPNGRYVVYGNIALTGQYAGEPEILRYDAGAAEKHEQSIVCVSCSPPSATVQGGAQVPRSSLAEINGADRQRDILNDGRVLFNTNATLVPQDVNHQADVYEWENGAPHLISAGTSEAGSSVFADASTNGNDIFFTTGQSLVPQDEDEISDVYDARENGGFPPPPKPTCANTERCPSTITPPPPLITASGSATFTGAESFLPSITPTTKSTTKPKPLTRSQKLAKALKSCHTKRNKKKRTTCETSAHKRYGPIHHIGKPKHRNRA
jgi:hypothetical protein